MPNRLDAYINRKKLEKKLLEKMSHRHLYITTLDGGGGFGKTETTKELIWSIIKNDYIYDVPENLKFDYVIWLSAKIEFFNRGEIEQKEQVFSTLEDLLDCILYVTNNHHLINDSIEKKQDHVIKILNQVDKTLLILDNFETVSEKDLIWEYMIRLGNEVVGKKESSESSIRIIITSRTSTPMSVFQRLGIKAMEIDEASTFIVSEMERLDLPKAHRTKKAKKAVLDFSGRIPLLIRYFVHLLKRGYNIEELYMRMSSSSDSSLDFMCKYQWDELSDSARTLLMSIAYEGGDLHFAQAMTLCDMTHDEFILAKEELLNHSFLLDQTLISSRLQILPPIMIFSRGELDQYPEIEEKFLENRSLIEVPSASVMTSREHTLLFSNEIALNQHLQKANLYIRKNELDEAYNWLDKAVKRFPDNAKAWMAKGEFEFRHKKDEKSGRESIRHAISLDAKDPVIYWRLAYWEYTTGYETSRNAPLRKSVELNEKAIMLSCDDYFIKRARDFIARAFLQLAKNAKIEFFNLKNEDNPSNYHSLNNLQEKIDHYFSLVIEILEGNLYVQPLNNSKERQHNVIDFDLLAYAYLSRGGRFHKSRRLFDLKAISYLINALKIYRNDWHIAYRLMHTGVKLNLEQSFGIKYDKVTEATINKILENETNIHQVISELEGDGKG